MLTDKTAPAKKPAHTAEPLKLQVYNTLTRKKEPFVPLVPPKVGMYVCGPTVYKPSHIGHMVGPVIFDTIKRFLTYCGYQVTWVVNITDVDDKLIVRAKEQNTTVKELAEKMTADYLDCLHALGVTGIDIMPKATETIPEMLQVIGDLIAKGYAYPAGGDVYFDVSKDHDYGKLCNRDPEQMEAGARIEVSEKKRNPGDFALWKGTKPGEPAWDSPWGPGRPGWHIECTAMSIKVLGKTLDIHGGGLDLQFPHHENELAQSESWTGQTFAKYWLHNGLLKMGKGKMAGSVGNVLNVVDVLQKVSGDVVRFFVINTHYRSPIDLGDYDPKTQDLPAGLTQALKTYESFTRFAERYQRVTKQSFYELEPLDCPPTGLPFAQPRGDWQQKINVFWEHFLAAMTDDFNTGGAIGVLFQLRSALNEFADEHKLESPGAAPDAMADFTTASRLMRLMGTRILGLFTAPPSQQGAADSGLVAGLMDLIIAVRADVRSEAKASKNKALFAVADKIRDGLAKVNIALEDRADGTSWSVKR